MPLYEFECTRCGHLTEVLQRLSDPPLEKCPQCGGPVRKLLSAPAFQFKGSGWYVTDYARKGKTDGGTEAKGDGGGKGEGGEKPGAGGAGPAKGKKADKPAAGSSSD